jgi:hypothetical protein
MATSATLNTLTLIGKATLDCEASEPLRVRCCDAAAWTNVVFVGRI